jgi:mannosyl-glycoprotein endo-beta-N-acetylglucosaminidase
MTPFVRRFLRPGLVALLAVIIGLAACSPVKSPSPAGTVPVMGQSALTWQQMAQFFWPNDPPGAPCLTVSLEQLTQYFVWEGNVENVRGDIAFAQALIETGWFRYGGSVQCGENNYGGFLGKSFPDADTGVRAQIQHLRAYADPSATSCSQPPLSTPCADPVFNAVNPKGKAPNWNDMGNGNWAAASDYAGKVLTVYNEMRRYSGLPPV